MSTSVKAETLGRSGASRCVLTQCQEGKTSTMILEEHWWLPIHLGRVIGPFPNNLESIIPQWERSSTNGKHCHWQLPIFQGVDVPASLHQGQTVQCSEKLQKPQELHLSFLQASVRMLVRDSTIWKRLNKHDLFGRISGERLFSLKRVELFGRNAPHHVWQKKSITSVSAQTPHTNWEA